MARVSNPAVRGYELRIECDYIDITSNTPSWDRQAEWTDAKGHVHRVVPKTFIEEAIPTDDRFPDGSVIYLHQQRCPICRELISIPTTTMHQFLPGPKATIVTYPDGLEAVLTARQSRELEGPEVPSLTGESGLPPWVVTLLERFRSEGFEVVTRQPIFEGSL